MARGYRSRRYRPSRRIGRRFKKSSSMRKVKKDILKCNFPTKVKFMGLSERKVMFLTRTEKLALANTNKCILLNPLLCPNVISLMDVDSGAKLSNWDKFCILGIYIKMQPVKNQWTGAAADTINEVQCTYTYNNCPEGQAATFDNDNINRKQIFTFNSNEAFTIYIPAPPTMSYRDPIQVPVNGIPNVTNATVTIPQSSDCVVHKSKTWWSLADLKANTTGRQMIGEEEEGSMDYDGESDEDMIGSPYDNTTSPIVHAGRLFFKCSGAASYNVTINYKVALKG